MAPRKYTNGRKSKREGGNEVLGIGLIIVSAFILLCIVIPPLIGIVSQFFYGVITGVFGFVSYPLFIGLLVLGIALLQDWKISLPGKQIAAIAVIAFSFVMILQLAVTHNYLSVPFSEYISRVYGAKAAACGALFGVLAYGMKTALTAVFSYILLSALIVIMAFLLLGVGKKNIFKSRKHTAAPETPQYKFVKGEATPQPVQPVTDTSLFVDSIMPTAPQIPKTESGSFHGLSEPQRPPVSGYGNETPVYQTTAGYGNYGYGTSSTFEPYHAPSQPEPPKAKPDSRSEAHRILFEDNRSNYPTYDPGAHTTQSSNTSVLPDVISSQPAVKTSERPTFAKPPKIVHNDAQPAQKPFDVVFPEPKDFTDQIVGGTIINGDDLSMQLMEQRAKRPSEPQKESLFDSRPKLDDFSVRKIEADSLRPIAEPITESAPEPAPIMNGDLFTESLLKKQSDSILRAESPMPTYEPEPVAPAEPYISNAPIGSESSFEKLLREDRAIRDREPAQEAPIKEPVAPIVNGDTVQPESLFKIEDEVVDLSEKADSSEQDFTGYYQPVINANTMQDRASRKSRAVPGQINLDDYGKNVPEPEPPKPPKKKKRVRYVAPPIELLMNNSTNPEDYGGDSQEKAHILEQTLESLKLPAKVVQITKGPAVTRYELEMQPGIPIKRIESFQSDIAYNLASNGKIRIETPIPGKRAVGVEVPNEQIAIVALRDIIESKQFQTATSPLTLALGKDIAGQNIVCQLEKMPHLLIAGSTGSGKSACLNSIIMSILYKSSPEDVRMILIDPKEVEFAIYKNMPHLLIKDIINDTAHAVSAFKWAKFEMDRRYKLLSKYCVRSLAEFNNSQIVKDGIEEKLPRIVIIVDELCELIMSPAKKELEERIMSMAQKARAAGLHLILATQRPSVDVITGTIKANLPSRVAFAVTSYNDSRTILDQGGAEALLGRGDMLYAPNDMPEPKRVQGAYVTTEEVSTIVSFVKENNPCDYDEDVENEIMVTKEAVAEKGPADDEDDDGFDVLMKQVLKRVIISGQASTSMIQRRFSVGYARASRIVDQMESNRFIGPLEGSKPREVYITREQFRELFDEDVDDIS